MIKFPKEIHIIALEAIRDGEDSTRIREAGISLADVFELIAELIEYKYVGVSDTKMDITSLGYDLIATKLKEG